MPTKTLLLIAALGMAGASPAQAGPISWVRGLFGGKKVTAPTSRRGTDTPDRLVTRDVEARFSVDDLMREHPSTARAQAPGQRMTAKQRKAADRAARVARRGNARAQEEQEPANSMTLDVTHGGLDFNSNRLGGLGVDSRGDLTIGLGNGIAYDIRTGEEEIKLGGITLDVGGHEGGGHHHHQQADAVQTQTFDAPTFDPPAAVVDVQQPDPFAQ
jgi:hypothetical protein